MSSDAPLLGDSDGFRCEATIPTSHFEARNPRKEQNCRVAFPLPKLGRITGLCTVCSPINFPVNSAKETTLIRGSGLAARSLETPRHGAQSAIRNETRNRSSMIQSGMAALAHCPRPLQWIAKRLTVWLQPTAGEWPAFPISSKQLWECDSGPSLATRFAHQNHEPDRSKAPKSVADFEKSSFPTDYSVSLKRRQSRGLATVSKCSDSNTKAMRIIHQ